MQRLKLKILITTDVYPPEPRGGARYAQSIAEQLNRRGHQVVVLTTAFPGFAMCTEETGLLVYRVHGFFSRIPFLYQVKEGRFPPPLKDWLLYRELRQVLEKHEPDVVHSQGWIVHSLIPALGKYNIPLVMSVGDYRAICPLVMSVGDYRAICPAAGMVPGASHCGMSLSFRCVACSRSLYGAGLLGMAKSIATYAVIRRNKSGLDRVDKFIAISEFVKKVHMEHLGMDESRFAVIPPFYSHEDGGEVESSQLLPDDFILFVGALVPGKGVDVLIEAYRRMKTETRLVMIGIEYPHYNYQDRDDRIILIIKPSRNVVLEAYSKCRFVVFPSVAPEPAGIVVLEAMANGKAVVASRIGGLTDIVADRETGILVPPGDADALAQAVRYLLDNPLDAVTMGRSGYERWMRLFTPGAVIPQIEQIYQDLLT